MVLFAVGVSGVASVTLHVLLGDGHLPCCVFPTWLDRTIPVLVGCAIGLPAALMLSRAGASKTSMEPSASCAACGHEVSVDWRLCPECGYIFDECERRSLG